MSKPSRSASRQSAGALGAPASLAAAGNVSSFGLHDREERGEGAAGLPCLVEPGRGRGSRVRHRLDRPDRRTGAGGGARVVIGYWDDDFGRARNACLEACRGEWVLWIDADERFECLGVPALRQALAQRRDLDGMLTTIYNRTGDGTGPGSLHQAIRVFRKANCRWYGKLHEQVDARPGLGRGLNVARLDGTQIDHYGYLDEVVKERDKLARNLHMARDELANGTVAPGQEGVPELNVGRALAALERYAEAQPYLDQALEVAHEGPPERAALLFRAQNLLSLGRCDEAAATARRFREVCQKKGLALYLEGAALRRSGHPHEAVALLEEVGEAANEDGFSFAANLLLVELAGALIEAGRTGEATDHLVRLVSISPSPGYVAAAMQAFAASDRAVRDLALAMPEQHLDKVAAALLIVPPVIAEPLADALFCRFGPKPELLAAATKFAPMVGTARALEWSARLRGIGMAASCPLLAQARMAVLAVPERAGFCCVLPKST